MWTTHVVHLKLCSLLVWRKGQACTPFITQHSPHSYHLDTAFPKTLLIIKVCDDERGNRPETFRSTQFKDQSSINGFAAEADVRACCFLFLLNFGYDFHIFDALFFLYYLA